MNTEKMSHVVSMTANVGVLIGLSLIDVVAAKGKR